MNKEENVLSPSAENREQNEQTNFLVQLVTALSAERRGIAMTSVIGAASGTPSRGYNLVSVTDLPDGSGILAYLTPIAPGDDFGTDIPFLEVTARYETGNRIRVRITDANSTRWEIPQSLISRPSITDPLPPNLPLVPVSEDITSNPNLLSPSNSDKLKFSYTSSPFGFAITRAESGEVLFNSTPADTSSAFRPLVFKDQYIEISTTLPTNSALFGLGESTRPDGLRLTPGRTYTLWAADIGASSIDINLYGVYPYYVDVREGGRTHSVLLMNSNAMDVVHGGDYFTYKVIGGILDFYFFAGPTPAAVSNQYTELVGRPVPVPYWSLGFHQCKWGYKNVEMLEYVVSNYKAANIPLDTIWSDIDHMDAYKDFTLDPVNFPREKLQPFLKKLHADGQHYVLIVDPGIATDPNYPTFTRGLAEGIYIKDADGSYYLGQVWPGPVYFPDFLHPKIQDFWSGEISRFHRDVEFDGLWIDMNEASNFCSGVLCSIGQKPMGGDINSITTCYLNCSVSSGSKWENPPYLINNSNGTSRNPLNRKTIGVNSKHAGRELEYNMHNMYGFSEAAVTYRALLSLRKRPFVLSRSTFVGAGKYAAHWTGDNSATWNDLSYSVVSVLNSGVFGVSMVGADICGFNGNTTEELCARWIELGAFYPFSRNHADIRSSFHELYVWESVASISRKVLGLRYRLLPYLYTLAFQAHTEGVPIARPLFYEYPADPKTLDVDTQFLLGKGILVSPVLDEHRYTVEAYFPQGSWYDLFDYTVIEGKGAVHVLQAPLDTINVHLAQGRIIPMQDAALTTAEARKSQFTLLIAFSNSSEYSEASGELFLDDGESIEMKPERGSSTFIRFRATKSGTKGSMVSEVMDGEFALKYMEPAWSVKAIVLLGLTAPPSKSTLAVNNQPPHSLVDISHEGLSTSICNLNVLLGQEFTLTW
ncbi:hypothetical protein R1flu_028768 [Riccia fluitans]|uniref:alpha-glucosidase n=1 Tax=Riccia fluitans TaxID=41844 RepID=A0ABD1XN68_9MARC